MDEQMIKQRSMRKCIVCGSEFQATRFWAKSCSKKCRDQHTKDRMAKSRQLLREHEMKEQTDERSR